MVMIDFSQRICARKFVGHKIVPKGGFVTECKNQGNENDKYEDVRNSSTLVEVYAKDKHGTEQRYTVDIGNKTCSCRKWKVTGLPCCNTLRIGPMQVLAKSAKPA